MRTLRSIIVAALTLAAAQLASAAGVTGKWKSEFDSPVGHLKYTFDLKADNDRITGKAMRDVDGEKTETEIKEGKLTGDQVAFVEVLNFNDQEFRIQYTGKLKDDEIKFTRKVGDIATMEIVAKREGASTPGTSTNTGSKIALKVVKVDSEETLRANGDGEDGRGQNAVDGNKATFWHTPWVDDNPRPPHEIIIELTPPSRIKGFTYLPRQDEEVNGNIKSYEFYVSNDGKEFGPAVSKGTFDESKDLKTVKFDVKACRFIKLKALSEINDAAWTSAAEIGVVAE